MVQFPGTATVAARRRSPSNAAAGTASGLSKSSSDQRPSSERRSNAVIGTCIASRLSCSTVGSAQGLISPMTGSMSSSWRDGRRQPSPRSRAATSSGTTGLKNSSLATSAAAMNRGTQAERHGETISMLNQASSCPLPALGRWFSHIM